MWGKPERGVVTRDTAAQPSATLHMPCASSPGRTTTATIALPTKHLPTRAGLCACLYEPSDLGPRARPCKSLERMMAM